MDTASVYYLGVTILLCVIFGIIVARTYSPKRREREERAKFRMMDGEEPLPPERREGERQQGERPKEDAMSASHKEDPHHHYDGITYRPNDTPPLVFQILYYGLWVWGLCFMGYFLFSGWSSHGEYAEIKKAKEARLAAAKAVGAQPERISTNEERRSTRLIGEGKTTFAARCVSCHGQNGKGGIGPDLTSKQYKYGRTAPDVTQSVTDGRPGGMPSFKNELSHDQIEGVVEYVLSL